MSQELFLSVFSVIVSALAAVYARWSFSEAKKSNRISRLNSLIALHSHYHSLIDNQMIMAKMMKESEGFKAAAHKRFVELDAKFKEVDREIEAYHLDIVGAKI